MFVSTQEKSIKEQRKVFGARIMTLGLGRVIALELTHDRNMKHDSSDGKAVDYKLGCPEFKSQLWIQRDHCLVFIIFVK